MKKLVLTASLLIAAIVLSGCIESESPPEQTIENVYGTLLEVVDNETFRIQTMAINCQLQQKTITLKLPVELSEESLKPEEMKVNEIYSFKIDYAKRAFVIEKIDSMEEFFIKNVCFNPQKDISTEYLDAVIPIGVPHTDEGGSTVISHPGGLNTITKGKENKLNFLIKNDSYFDVTFMVKKAKLVGKTSHPEIPNTLQTVETGCEIDFDDSIKTLEARSHSDFSVSVSCSEETPNYSFIYLQGEIEFTGPDEKTYTVQRMTSKSIEGRDYIHSAGNLTSSLAFGNPATLEIDYPVEITAEEFYLKARYLDEEGKLIEGADVRIATGNGSFPFDYLQDEGSYVLNLDRQANANQTYRDLMVDFFSEGEHQFVVNATKEGYATAQKTGTVAFN